MEPACLSHRLTEAERNAFERDGYVLLPGALDADLLVRVHAVTDRLDAEHREAPGVTRHHVLNRHDLLGLDDVFVDLLDLATTFPKVWGILGWHVQLFHTQLLVTPPAPAGARPGGYGWHQDNNRMNLDFETPPPHPRVSVKLGYLLTDAPDEGCGTMWVVPGSHVRGRPSVPLGEQPDGARPVLGRAGDAVLFDRRLWHASSTNVSDAERRVLFYGYSYRWLRTKSAMADAELLARVDPIRRQLLGWATSANGYFDPQPEDVPLRAWLEEHDALATAGGGAGPGGGGAA